MAYFCYFGTVRTESISSKQMCQAILVGPKTRGKMSYNKNWKLGQLLKHLANTELKMSMRLCQCPKYYQGIK